MPIEDKTLSIFLQAVAVALRELELDPPHSAQTVLDLVFDKLPQVLDDMPQASPQERDAMMLDQLALLAMLKTFVETLP